MNNTRQEISDAAGRLAGLPRSRLRLFAPAELRVAGCGPDGEARRPCDLSTRFLLSLIWLYRHTLSPAQALLFGPDHGCRFTPTCSQYARDAIQEHGAVAGGLLALKRLCRCHPFGGCGDDPAPKRHTGAENHSDPR